ncbi:hypothetical protein HOY80DRAFT_1098763 [Tuber brumale]|nr:hypothetical protein HOY80DRAFT_1098763 [Tuber brumale]
MANLANAHTGEWLETPSSAGNEIVSPLVLARFETKGILPSGSLGGTMKAPNAYFLGESGMSKFECPQEGHKVELMVYIMVILKDANELDKSSSNRDGGSCDVFNPFISSSSILSASPMIQNFRAFAYVLGRRCKSDIPPKWANQDPQGTVQDGAEI